MPNGTYGGVKGEKFTKNYPLLDLKNILSHMMLFKIYSKNNGATEISVAII